MEDSEKYTKLIELAQTFDACQNDLLHYQKVEIIDKWNNNSSGTLSDDSASMVNIRKTYKKIKRAKSCLNNNINRLNCSRDTVKLSPSMKKTTGTKLKKNCNIPVTVPISIPISVPVPIQKKDTLKLKREIFLKKKSCEGLLTHTGGIIKKQHSTLYTRGKSNDNNSNNNNVICKNNNNINKVRKNKFNRMNSIFRGTISKVKKSKETKLEKSVQMEQQGKKKLKMKRQTNILLKKCQTTDMIKTANNVINHTKSDKLKKNSKELLNKKTGKKNYFTKKKKGISLKKKNKINNRQNIECNDSVNSAGSILSEDTLNSNLLSKTEGNNLLFLSVNEQMRKWTKPINSFRSHSENIHCYHKLFFLNTNEELPRKYTCNEKKKNEKYEALELELELDKKDNPERKQSICMNDKGYIKKDFNFNKKDVKDIIRTEMLRHSSDSYKFCENDTSEKNISIENKNIKKELLQKEKNTLQKKFITFSKKTSDPLFCDNDNINESITCDHTFETKNRILPNEEKPKKYKQLDIKSCKKLLKALDESNFFIVTKKHYQKKSKLKNKRISINNKPNWKSF